MVAHVGFEPTTYRFEGDCSFQLMLMGLEGQNSIDQVDDQVSRILFDEVPVIIYSDQKFSVRML